MPDLEVGIDKTPPLVHRRNLVDDEETEADGFHCYPQHGTPSANKT